MKTANPLKTPFGKARHCPIRHVHFQQWEDAFEVEFEDGLSFLEPHETIRVANRISSEALPVRVVLDEELKSGFFVHYDNQQVAEVSWSFIKEHPPEKP